MRAKTEIISLLEMSSSVGEGNALSIIDWGVFAGTLAGIACLGSFAGRTTVKEGSGAKSEYVFGTGGKGGFAVMASSLPTMMLSIARGTTGIRVFIGFPSEHYYFGIRMWELLYGTILSFPIIAFLFVPVYYDLGVTSVYQYLELRFRSRTARCIASGTYAIRSIIMLGVTMLTPSIALSGLAGLPLWVSILIIGTLTVAGSVTGGLRGVVIVDALQGVLLFLVCLFLAVLGCYHAGGILKTFQINRERGRLDFFDFDFDPTLRISTVSALIGQLGMSLTGMGCQQNFAQRYCSMPSKKSVVMALLGNIPLSTVVFSMPWLVGIAMFAAMADCDPYAAGKTSRYDGVVTYFINKYFNPFPGMSGLFLAIICNSALNILVSNLNAIATVMWEDFVSQIQRFKNVSDTKQLLFIRGIAMFSACIIISLAFTMALLPGINEASMLTNAVTSGALLGMFLLATLFPAANGKGVVVGALAGHILTFWVAIGALTVDTSGVKTQVHPLPTTIAGCNDSFIERNNTVARIFQFDGNVWRNYSTDLVTYDVINVSGQQENDAIGNQNTDFLTKLYAMSYMYYNLFGCLITVVVGLVVSYFTGNSKKDMYEERMVHPKAIKLSRLFPGKQRVFARPGSTFNSELTRSNSVEVSTIMETKKMDKDLGIVNKGLELNEKLS